nr:hypothetical protein [Tanacetum cinerariifolium]
MNKKNRLMRINELHKFSDGTLIDVRTALDDRLKGIQMQYLPQSIWRKSNKERAAAMIQAIDKRLKTRRIMMSLERGLCGCTTSFTDYEQFGRELLALNKFLLGMNVLDGGDYLGSKDGVEKLLGKKSVLEVAYELRYVWSIIDVSGYKSKL